MTNWIRPVGLPSGPGLAVVAWWWLPESYLDAAGAEAPFSPAGRATLAMLVWMAAWWLTEAVDLAATALLPLATFPLLGIAGIREAAVPYADPMIYLFLGGFLIALSMQRWGLDRRIALLTLRRAGPRPDRMVGGFMIATAVLSGFVSNTATAAMMLPIAVSVIRLTRGQLAGGQDREGLSGPMSACLMLGIAYAASLGGVMTLIGTPPNAFLAGFLRDSIAERYRIELSFQSWLWIGVPLTVVFLPIVWWVLTRLVFPIGGAEIPGGRELIGRELRGLGSPSRGERITLAVFLGAAILWITRPLLTSWQLRWDDAAWHPLAGLSDAGIAIGAAMVLFVLPSGDPRRPRVLDWETAHKLPWGILVLFGGGLSLANAVHVNGVAEFLGSRAGAIAWLPPALIVLVIIAGIVFMTELTSNLATAATLLPILAAMGPGLGIHPHLLVIPAAIAASCAFMLPVATPPNAIVFGSGFVTQSQMIRAGVWLNVIGIGLIGLLAAVVIRPWLAG